MRTSGVQDIWCQAGVVGSALIPVCKQALEGSLKPEEQCIVVFPSLAHKTLLFVMPYNKPEEIPDSDDELPIGIAELDESDAVMRDSEGDGVILRTWT